MVAKGPVTLESEWVSLGFDEGGAIVTVVLFYSAGLRVGHVLRDKLFDSRKSEQLCSRFDQE